MHTFRLIRPFHSWYIFGLCLLGLGGACQPDDPHTLTLSYARDPVSQQVPPVIQGVWQSIGNGYYLEARPDSLLIYSYTSSFCYKELNDYLEGLLNKQSQYRIRRDTLEIYLTDYGVETESLQSKKDFVKVEALPPDCMGFAEMKALSPPAQFKLYQEHLQENYAFTQERNLNWMEIFAAYGDTIFRDEKSLFEAMGAVATLTRDQHTKVINASGTRLQYNITPSALIVQQAFEEQDSIKQLNDYFNLFFNQNYQYISDSILAGKGQKLGGNDNLEWGLMDGNIGYLHIHSFAGFLSRDFSRKQQIDSLRFWMEHIVDALGETDAMIIDISFNFGGYDAAALTIASYFTDKVVWAFQNQVFHKGGFYQEDETIIYPASSGAYSQPVYLLMTDISRSAAEGFAMMMDALPQAQLVGSRTLGTLSGMLGKSVSTFYTTYSNQRFLNADGEYFERRGVGPDIEMEVFPSEEVMQGHLKAVRKMALQARKDASTFRK